ncbi:hypothetical protein JXA40_12040 [bacterium]|nr:hypothetical protein [candidate division CSSED10-310 bacterium]
MKNRNNIVFKLFVLAVFLSVLTGCLAGPNSHWTEPKAPSETPKAGFFAGLWHGLIAVFTLILGIFTDIKVYEINNTGWFYDLGFLIGVGAFSHGGIRVVHKRKK